MVVFVADIAEYRYTNPLYGMVSRTMRREGQQLLWVMPGIQPSALGYDDLPATFDTLYLYAQQSAEDIPGVLWDTHNACPTALAWRYHRLARRLVKGWPSGPTSPATSPIPP